MCFTTNAVKLNSLQYYLIFTLLCQLKSENVNLFPISLVFIIVTVWYKGKHKHKYCILDNGHKTNYLAKIANKVALRVATADVLNMVSNQANVLFVGFVTKHSNNTLVGS